MEGEGALNIQIKDDAVTRVQLKIFEPPRFFEAFLKGRNFTEAPDITCRICGICPVAYQMSAVHAMESALGVAVPGPIRALRRLLYCGEWIESHGLHVFMLHAPDFLGYQDAIQMAQDHPDTVKMGLKLKKVGNDIVSILGGREIHPINVRVGGFYKAPSKRDLAPLAESLKWAREAAVKTVRWVGGFTFPEFERDYEFVALRHGQEYPFNEGRLVSNKGLDIDVRDYEQHFVEEQVPHSHALHSTLKARGSYFAGPLARYNLNFDRLTPLAQEMAREAGLGPVCRNPFQSIIVRAVETALRGGGGVGHHRGLREAGSAGGAGCAPGGGGLRRHRSPPGVAVPPLPAGRERRDPRSQDRAADLPEPGDHRGRPASICGPAPGFA